MVSLNCVKLPYMYVLGLTTMYWGLTTIYYQVFFTLMFGFIGIEIINFMCRYQHIPVGSGGNIKKLIVSHSVCISLHVDTSLNCYIVVCSYKK